MGVAINTVIRDQGPNEAAWDRLRAAAARGRTGETGYGSHDHIYAQTPGRVHRSRQTRGDIASI